MSTLDDIIAQLERNAIDYGTDESEFPNVWNEAATIKETTQNFEEKFQTWYQYNAEFETLPPGPAPVIKYVFFFLIRDCMVVRQGRAFTSYEARVEYFFSQIATSSYHQAVAMLVLHTPRADSPQESYIPPAEWHGNDCNLFQAIKKKLENIPCGFGSNARRQWLIKTIYYWYHITYWEATREDTSDGAATRDSILQEITVSYSRKNNWQELANQMTVLQERYSEYQLWEDLDFK